MSKIMSTEVELQSLNNDSNVQPLKNDDDDKIVKFSGINRIENEFEFD
jgi:hypothetical protein